MQITTLGILLSTVQLELKPTKLGIALRREFIIVLTVKSKYLNIVDNDIQRQFLRAGTNLPICSAPRWSSNNENIFSGILRCTRYIKQTTLQITKEIDEWLNSAPSMELPRKLI